VNGRSTVSLVRDPLILQARGPKTLFSNVNAVSWLKEYGLHLSVFMGGEHQRCAKLTHSSEFKEPCSS
jgi:hypothetical protein